MYLYLVYIFMYWFVHECWHNVQLCKPVFPAVSTRKIEKVK